MDTGKQVLQLNNEVEEAKKDIKEVVALLRLNPKDEILLQERDRLTRLLDKTLDQRAQLAEKLDATAAGPGPWRVAVIAEVRSVVRQAVKPLAKLFFKFAISPKSSTSSIAYRPKALEYYTGNSSAETIVCAVSGRPLPASEVKAGHIYQRRWPLVDDLGFHINEPRNILFMQKKIEEHYDNFNFTVLPVTLKVLLLNKSLKERSLVADEYVISDSNRDGVGSAADPPPKVSVTWAELDGKVLTLPDKKRPFDKALWFHAQRAFMRAVDEGWCKKSELPTLDYGDMQLMLQFLIDSDSAGTSPGRASSASADGEDESELATGEG